MGIAIGGAAKGAADRGLMIASSLFLDRWISKLVSVAWCKLVPTVLTFIVGADENTRANGRPLWKT
jgi:hypothetical protein